MYVRRFQIARPTRASFFEVTRIDHKSDERASGSFVHPGFSEALFLLVFTVFGEGRGASCYASRSPEVIYCFFEQGVFILHFSASSKGSKWLSPTRDAFRPGKQASRAGESPGLARWVRRERLRRHLFRQTPLSPQCTASIWGRM